MTKKQTTKTILLILVILLVCSIYFRPDVYTLVWNGIKTTANKIITEIKDFLDTGMPASCPQIDVPIEETSWGELRIEGKTYDGWTIKGGLTCRKGKQ